MPNEILRKQLKSKIHRARLTEANIDYVGSITLDPILAEAVDLWNHEHVLVVSVTSGARLETYVILGKRGSGEICLNGAAAHHMRPGEEIIIMAFTWSNEPVEAKIIFVDPMNAILEVHSSETPR